MELHSETTKTWNIFELFPRVSIIQVRGAKSAEISHEHIDDKQIYKTYLYVYVYVQSRNTLTSESKRNPPELSDYAPNGVIHLYANPKSSSIHPSTVHLTLIYMYTTWNLRREATQFECPGMYIVF